MKKSEWKILGASIIGKAHIKSNQPCQDAHIIEFIDSSKGIAIVSDGAGSCENSHLGSGFVVETLKLQMIEVLKKTALLEKDFIVDEDLWRNSLIKQLKILEVKLKEYAIRESVDYKSLSCTLILLLFSDHRLLVSNIGDGRAGYSNDNLEWKSLFTPFKGSQVGETVFITSDIFNNHEQLIGTQIIEDNIKSFTLLSDGCELASWECNHKNLYDDTYYDPNNPYPDFFNPCVKALKSMHMDNLSDQEINTKWIGFLENGNKTLQKETDDKTMILGTIITEEN